MSNEHGHGPLAGSTPESWSPKVDGHQDTPMGRSGLIAAMVLFGLGLAALGFGSIDTHRCLADNQDEILLHLPELRDGGVRHHAHRRDHHRSGGKRRRASRQQPGRGSGGPRGRATPARLTHPPPPLTGFPRGPTDNHGVQGFSNSGFTDTPLSRE